MHPAQPLPPGVTSVSAGAGSHWIGGQARRKIDAAQSQWAASQGGPQSLTPSAALAAALWTPGVFPWVSMRLGLGSQNEAGLAYTGQHARLDARHAFGLGRWAMSVGLGATMGLMHMRAINADGTSTFESSESLAGLDTSNVRSIGVDLPFIVGWRSAADVARLVQAAETGLGPIGVLVNNAAVCPHGTTATTDLETWEKTIGANLRGTFLTCREFLRRLEGKGPPGRIVNVSSVSAFSGSTSGQAAYDA